LIIRELVVTVMNATTLTVNNTVNVGEWYGVLFVGLGVDYTVTLNAII